MRPQAESSSTLTAGGLALLLVLPFLHKAVHIDDLVYLGLASLIDKQGLASYGGWTPWYGRLVPIIRQTHPPLVPFFFAFVGRAAGTWNPDVMHAAAAGWALLAALSAHALARRFTRRPLLASALVIGCPAFLVNAHNLMTDVPTAALMLAAVEACLRADEDRSLPWRAAAALLTALALQSSYQALFLLPLFALQSWRSGGSWRAFVLTVGPGLVLLAALQRLFAAEDGGLHLLTALDWMGDNPILSMERLGNNLAGNLCVLGGATVFPAVLARGFYKGRRNAGSLALAGAASLAILAAKGSGLPWSSKILLALFFFNGTAAALALLRTTATALRPIVAGPGRLSDPGFLALWCLGYLAAATVLLPYGVSRYLLPALAPFAFLFVIGLDATGAGRSARWSAAVGTVVLGLAVAAGDYDTASLSRDAASCLIPALGSSRTWFVGEGGFRYYFNDGKARYLLSRGTGIDGAGLEDGDWVAVQNPAGLDAAVKARLVEAGTVRFDGRWPVRTISRPSGADFYSGEIGPGKGLLPYAFDGRAAMDIHLLRSRRLASYRGIPRLASKPAAVFGGRLALVGMRASPSSARAGEPLTVVLLWSPLRRLAGWRTGLRLRGDLRSFTFVHDREEGRQAPALWSSSGSVAEAFRFPRLSREIYPGRYRVEAAAWTEDRPPEALWRPVGWITVGPTAREVPMESLGDGRLGGAADGRGWSFVLSPGDRLEIPLRAAGEAKAARLVSYLAYASAVDQGEPVATFEAVDESASTATFILRAGIETADNAALPMERLGIRLAHGAAPPFDCWSAEPRSGRQAGCSYAARWELPRGFKPRRLVVREVSKRGILTVEPIYFER